jgi:hypothetical protein
VYPRVSAVNYITYPRLLYPSNPAHIHSSSRAQPAAHLLRIDIPQSPRNFLDTGNLQSLSLLNGLNKHRCFQKGLMCPGIQPGKASTNLSLSALSFEPSVSTLPSLPTSELLFLQMYCWVQENPRQSLISPIFFLRPDNPFRYKVIFFCKLVA